MAQAPKSKPLTQKAKLDKLKALHIIGPTTKTFNKNAKSLWDEYTKIFPKNTAGNQSFMQASPAARKAAGSVNMRVLGNAVVFPTASGGRASLRETKHGVFIDYGQRGDSAKRNNTIILSKTGNHIQYGMKLAKREALRGARDEHGALHAWGTLKTHAWNTKKNGTGEMIRGFMRDTAVSYEDPVSALYDDRYSKIPGDNDLSNVPLTKTHLNWLEETNGVAALIRVAY